MKNIILVLGSSGFIGKNIVQQALESGHQVVGIDIHNSETQHQNFKFKNLPISYNSVITTIAEENIDTIVHAGGSASVALSISQPQTDFDQNVGATFNILNAIKDSKKLIKFIYLSSAAVYGNPNYLPVDEFHPYNPISPYGYHKMFSEIICKEFWENFGISSLIFRVFSCYGEQQRKLFLWDLCQKIKANSNKVINLMGTGSESRDYIHVKDLSKCIVSFSDRQFEGVEIFNLASGDELFISDIAENILKQFDTDRKINFMGSENNGNPNNWRANISKLNTTGFKREISFNQGIVDYCNWFKNLI